MQTPQTLWARRSYSAENPRDAHDPRENKEHGDDLAEKLLRHAPRHAISEEAGDNDQGDPRDQNGHRLRDPGIAKEQRDEEDRVDQRPECSQCAAKGVLFRRHVLRINHQSRPAADERAVDDAAQHQQAV